MIKKGRLAAGLFCCPGFLARKPISAGLDLA
jgi:hypothetical protein